MNMTMGTLQILYEIAVQRIIILYLDKSTLPMYPGNEESALLKNKIVSANVHWLSRLLN